MESRPGRCFRLQEYRYAPLGVVQLLVRIAATRAPMATNLDIDPDLLEEAMKLGGHRTKRAAVLDALREYVERRNQLRILELFGTVDYDTDYDYKAQRSRR